jgi:hypothetical protein
MSRGWKTATVDVRDMTSDAPTSPPMLDAVTRLSTNPDTPVEHRAVSAGTVKVPDLSPLQAEFVAMCPRDAFAELRRWREEALYEVLARCAAICDRAGMPDLARLMIWQ